ncbi:MAG: PIN domain-containing protein [Solirubrobacterales bacterium]
MIHVLLDANAIGVDPPLGKLEHRVMLDAHRSGEIVLVVPRLALQEAVGSWKRDLTSQLDKLRNTRRQLEKLVPSHNLVIPTLDRHEAADHLLAELTQALETANVKTPDVPSVSHQDLINRAINRRQPFDKNGNGYRDALLWEITRELANDGKNVLLVSNDPAAFAQDRKRGMPLASPLGDEISGSGSVRLASDIKEAIAELGLVAPEALIATEAVIKRLGDDFGQQLLNQLETELIHPVHTWITKGFINPFLASEASLGVPSKLLRVTVEEARTAENGSLEATVLLEVRQPISVYLPTPASEQFKEIGVIQPLDDLVDGVEFDGVAEHRCRVVLDPMTDRLMNAEAIEAVAAFPEPRS